jgi:cobalt-zinc-cadmium efflux system protein
MQPSAGSSQLIAFWLLHERQKGNLNMQCAFWHIIQTFVGSLIIIISALVIQFTDFLAIDPILGMAFCLVLFWASWSIISSALRILLQSTPEDFDLKAAIGALQSIDGAKTFITSMPLKAIAAMHRATSKATSSQDK